MTENNDNTNATYKTLSDMIYMIKRVEALLLLQKDLGAIPSKSQIKLHKFQLSKAVNPRYNDKICSQRRCH